ncbi:single-strand DNA-binding protein [Thermonema lapsum]|jgi:single-strand DNA-binding protein|uniref:Single-stranded DNA-binding protein n=1 Tax=Thermonema lapsum TaxID=28195 RepID=A0A846MSW3_9BACT|nr:single-stranded DNA-binding protein [Thermonema lapsum]NIK74337.1 single-strand DNA-binding protein [Thermonema lapsum]
MARGLNKVILIGNLGADPEVRTLESGSVVATFNLATTEAYTDRQGNRQSITEWHRIEMWDSLAKIAEQYLRKGSQVYIEGKIRTDNWEDKDGNKRSTVKIRAQSMILLGGRPEEYASSSNASTNKPLVEQSSPSTEEIPPFLTDDNEDDLPF